MKFNSLNEMLDHFTQIYKSLEENDDRLDIKFGKFYQLGVDHGKALEIFFAEAKDLDACVACGDKF